MIEKNIKQSISSNIAYYRKLMKLTQADLARVLSVKPTTISTWERGASLPDAEMLFSLCSVFGITLSKIYGSDAIPYAPVYLDESEAALLTAYRSAPESRREAVRALLEIDEEILKKMASESSA